MAVNRTVVKGKLTYLSKLFSQVRGELSDDVPAEKQSQTGCVKRSVCIIISTETQEQCHYRAASVQSKHPFYSSFDPLWRV